MSRTVWTPSMDGVLFSSRCTAAFCCLFLLVALLLGSVTIPVAQASPESPSSTGHGPPPADAIREFVEDFVPAQLERHEIPGAAVSVVSSDELVFAKGYGLADVAKERQVDADQTAFASASVAKLLTATAVMQLVETGKIDLDTDVNDYLDFEIDDTFPDQPITTAHLLTHTAGFAARDSGTAARTAEDVRPLGEQLANHLPDRVRPPGEHAVYSNYGMGLAGYLVELRSGMPFHQYVEENILRPLEMDGTTFTQPAPQHIRQSEAIGYRVSDGEAIPADGAEYGPMPPHGAGFRSTATDMARFMQAVLGDGSGILEPDSIQQMKRQQFANSPGTPGMGYGFQEYTRNGQRLLVHRGSIPGSFAILAVIPERDIGLYASYNGGDSEAADSVWNLVDAFTDRFTPAGDHEPQQHDGSLPDPSEFTGTYRSMQLGDTTDLGKLASLFNMVTVTAEQDGTLRTSGPAALGSTEPRRWEQIAPALFRDETSGQTIEFGKEGLLATANPAQPLQRLTWHEHPNLHLAVFGVSLVVLVVAALGWPITYAVRRLRGRPRRAPRFAAIPAWTTAALVLGSATAVAMMFADFEANQAAFFYGTSPLLTAIGVFPLLGVVATVGAAATTTLAWRNAWWTRAGRIHHTAVVLGAAAYLALAFAYNISSTL